MCVDINRLLDVIEKDIVPLTEVGVRNGNKLFGAAILRKDDLSVVVAETNNEVHNPMWHGEVHCIKKFFEIPEDKRPMAKDCIFLATHEPCSLCLSGITWSGFDNFYYLFSYEDSRDSFKVPYDIDILQSVYVVPDPGQEVSPDRPLYNRKNKFFTSYFIKDLAKGDKKIEERIDGLAKVYDGLSNTYQSGKGGAANVAFK